MSPLSVIIPVWNEVSRLPGCLRALSTQPGVHEVIVVDGGSTDGTLDLFPWPHTVLVHAPKGRGVQLNAGARVATGHTLVFLHVDTLLPPGAHAHIHQALTDPKVVAGAFRTRTRLEASRSWIRSVLPLADLRSHYTKHPYGDQALFVRRETFEAVRGYPEQPLLEDVELCRRLWTQGRILVLPAKVTVSARRWAAHPWRTALIMNTFPWLYRVGVSPHTLARWYGDPR